MKRKDTVIVLKYTQNYTAKKMKPKAGFYIVTAACLLIVGGASWFALSNYANANGNISDLQGESEYNGSPSSYIESKAESVKSEIVEKKQQTESFISDQATESKSSADTASEAASAVEKGIKAFTMPVQGEVLKEYSNNSLQYSSTFGDMRLHSGIDIACQKGTAVSACSDGTVTTVEQNTALGNTVAIDHGDGLIVKYSSLDNIKVKTGDRVSAGDVIGEAGTVTCECEDSDHIHLEVSRNGEILSPLDALNLN